MVFEVFVDVVDYRLFGLVLWYVYGKSLDLIGIGLFKLVYVLKGFGYCSVDCYGFVVV